MRALRTLFSHQCQQAVSCHPEVREREQRSHCTVFSANLRNHTYVKYYNAMLRRCNHPVPHACRPRP
jgi:hypothetical protein